MHKCKWEIIYKNKKIKKNIFIIQSIKQFKIVYVFEIEEVKKIDPPVVALFFLKEQLDNLIGK